MDAAFPVNDALRALYNTGIIWEKYQNLVAVSTMYEYIASGRCDRLDGPYGAYNLYESELRQNIIIGQLSKIETHLEQIKENTDDRDHHGQHKRRHRHQHISARALMQQDRAVHSCGIYRLAPYRPYRSNRSHKGQEQQDAQGKQTADASPRLPAAVFRYSLFYYRNTLFCIVHTRKTSSLKTQLKKPFTYIGTKTQKNSHPKIKFFQKNLRAAQRQLPKEKNLFHYGVRRRASDFPAVRISTGRR